MIAKEGSIISLPNPVGQTLVFSFIGMTSVEMTLKNTEPLTVRQSIGVRAELIILNDRKRRIDGFQTLQDIGIPDHLQLLMGIGLGRTGKTLSD